MAVDLPPAVETVIVQPARLPPAAGDAAFSIVTLDAEALSTQPRIDEALTDTPGVSLFRRITSLGANPTIQGVSLRSIAGSGASRALVTLDGVPQSDPFGGWVIWSAIPSEILSGASIVRGAGAGPYGAGALTGVVALEEATTIPGGVAGEVSAGELGYRRAAAAVDVGSGVNRLLMSASGQHSDGWIPIEPGRRGAADTRLAFDAVNASARAQTEIGAGVLAVRAAGFREKRDGGLVYVGSRTEGLSGSVTYAAAPTANSLGWRLQAWIRTSNLANTSASVAADRNSTSPANNQYSTPATGYGFNAALRSAGGDFSWEVGGDVRISDGKVKEMSRLIGTRFTRTRVAGGQTLVGGVYAEASRTSGPWLFTGGVRVDRWSNSDAFRIEGDLVTGATTLNIQPADDHGTVPTARVGVRRTLDGDLAWRAAAYAGFRTPTLNELYRPFRVGNDITESNSGLKPERLYGVETGFDGGFARGGHWSVDAFYNRLEDAITNVTIGMGPGNFPIAGFVPAGGALRQRQNAGAIDALGVEFDAEAPLSETLTARLAAGYTHAKVDGGSAAPQLDGLRPAQTPRFSALVGMTWQVIEPLSARLDLRYEGPRFDDDANSRKLRSAVVVDARLDWRVSGPIGVYLAADNLFDENVDTALTGDGVYSYGPPRMVRAGITLRR